MNWSRFHWRRGGTLLIFALAGIATAVFRLASVQQAAAENLIVNGAFERVQNGVPDGWVLDKAVQGRGTLSVRSEQGRGVLELSPNSKNTDTQKPYGVGQLIGAAQLKGKTVRVSAAIRAEGGATGQFFAFAITSDFRPLSHSVLAETSGEYRKQSGTFRVDPEAAQILVGCVVLGRQGRAWFTEVSLETDGSAAANREAGPSASPQASVTVDTNVVLRPIPSPLYGTNIEWIEEGNGIWDRQNSAFNPNILRAARELGVTLVRFPGGIFADYYHWRDGVGPRQSRPARPHLPGGNASANDFGTAELVEFSRQIGAEPLFQVNMITGTPEEAAAWVSYCNNPNDPERRRDGTAQPFNVRFWEIGNEPYGKADNPNTARSSLTPEQYAARYLQFADAMKKADSSIRLIGAGGVNTERYVAVTNNDWDRIILERAGSKMDYLSVHNAYAPIAASASHASVEEVYRALFAFPQLIDRNLEDVSNQIELNGRRSPNSIEIAVTEWGPLFHALPTDSWVDHAKTLGSALYVAGAMQSFLRSAHVGMTNFFKLTEDSFLGFIGQGGEPKPSYYAFQMFTKHFGDLLVDAKAEGPGFSSRDIGNVAAVHDAPMLNVVAALSKDRDRLYLLAVNSSIHDAIRASIRLSGFRPVEKAKALILTGTSLDANNGPDLPSVPGLKWAKQASISPGSFDSGHPGTVRPKESALENAGEQFSFSFPAMSVVSIELGRAK